MRRKATVNWNYLGFAVAAEWAIIGATGFAGYQFAYHYTTEAMPTARVAGLGDYVPSMVGGDNTSFVMAIVATIMLCVVELIRVPMAIASRANNSIFMRGLCIVGVLFCCGVTTKSVSQVMEQMFHTRLRVVQEATTRFHVAEQQVKEAELGQSTAKDPSTANNGMVSELNRQIDEVTKSLALYGTPPKPVTRCVKNKRGNLSCSTTTPRWAGASAQQTRDSLIAKRDELMAQGSELTSKVSDASQALMQAQGALTEAEDVRKRAVMDSQLHSFTAMVFGKDPVEVTDGELHWFLRLFIFLPAVMIAFSATILAMASVTVVQRRKFIPSKQSRAPSVTIPGALIHSIQLYVKNAFENEMKTFKANKEAVS